MLKTTKIVSAVITVVAAFFSVAVYAEPVSYDCRVTRTKSYRGKALDPKLNYDADTGIFKLTYFHLFESNEGTLPFEVSGKVVKEEGVEDLVYRFVNESGISNYSTTVFISNYRSLFGEEGLKVKYLHVNNWRDPLSIVEFKCQNSN